MSRTAIFWTVFLVTFGLLMMGGLHTIREDPSALMRWTLPWAIANGVLPANTGQLLSLVATTIPLVLFCALVAFGVMLLFPRRGGGTEGTRLWNPPTFGTGRRAGMVLIALVACVFFSALVIIAWPSATYIQCQGQANGTTTVLRGAAAGESSVDMGATWTQSRIEGLDRGNDVTFTEITNGGDSLLAAVFTICVLDQRGETGYTCRLTVSRSHLSISAMDQSRLMHGVEISRLTGSYDVSAVETDEAISFELAERGTCSFDRALL